VRFPHFAGTNDVCPSASKTKQMPQIAAHLPGVGKAIVISMVGNWM
jgi:hypothetical protein